VAESRAPGLRLQILLALAGLLLLSFVPLYIAVASLARTTLETARERSARAIARAIAAHVADVEATGDAELVKRTIERHVAQNEVEALALFRRDGTLVASPASSDLAAIDSPAPPPSTGAIVRRLGGRIVDVELPAPSGVLVARLRFEEAGERGMPLVRLTAIYMGLFAGALLTFAYFALTRLIVRPVDALVSAADRVASGSRTLEIPRTGARELAELGSSVHAMTARLVADEAAMRKKVDELTALTKELRATQTQLARSERMASVGKLAAGVAHEVGNPITAMMGMEELLLEGDLPIETQRDFLARIKKETERIHTVVRDLLDFARPEEPRSGTGPAAPANVRNAIDDVVALVKTQKDFKAITLVVDVADDALAVTLPHARLSQVLLNLLLNAGAAAKGGSVTVRASKREGRARIEVEDDGPGVPAEMRERIFDPFVTTKDVGEGTGLGLSVCRGIVEAAGGVVALDAAFDRGARFYVELPLG
jgi:signal transduction histidine kinase